MPKPKTVRFYDYDTQTVARIPARELNERAIRGRVNGIKGVVYFEHALSDELVERIKKVAATFAEVCPDPLEKWLHDFNLDRNPEYDLTAWEVQAAVYERVVKASDTLERKGAIFSATFACCMYPWFLLPFEQGVKEVLANPNGEPLNRRDVKRICEEWVKELRQRVATA